MECFWDINVHPFTLSEEKNVSLDAGVQPQYAFFSSRPIYSIHPLNIFIDFFYHQFFFKIMINKSNILLQVQNNGTNWIVTGHFKKNRTILWKLRLMQTVLAGKCLNIERTNRESIKSDPLIWRHWRVRLQIIFFRLPVNT